MKVDAKIILEKHCPSMSSLYLDEQGRKFRDRIVNAMEEYASQFTPKKESKTIEETYGDLKLDKIHFIPIIQNWLSYKTQKRQTYKPIGLKTLMKKFNQFEGTYSELESIVENSIMNNYSGIIWNKTNGNNGKPTTTTDDAIRSFITE